MKHLPETITKTITDKNFKSLIIDIGEISLDAIFEDGILKDIPILGTIFSATKTTLSIRDRIFTHKLISFMYQLKDVSHSQKKKQIEKIEHDSKYKTKVGEKILFILDKCEDAEKAIYIGKLFQFYLAGKIEYEIFLRATRCIEQTFLPDFERFVNEKWDNIDMRETGDLVGAGLMNPVYIPRSQNWHNGGKAAIRAKVSSIGKLVQELFQNNILN